ncbi:hypothetical protein D8768_09705 [Enterobacter hormaechei]|uniref:hypothetical protein n=1 Tax=Enterobacter hormaechei TaxID=158836 RepID=UPI0012F83D70|nr:hypothetical protein [Enterobacter hormaechei]QGU36167.1 hypothetical protein D8768_09705 [Enterobacter hormaechei]
MDKRNYVRIVAAVIVALMFIIVPADKMVNGHPFDFTYKFIWNLGVSESDLFPYVVNVPLIVAQIFGVLAIVWLLSKVK